MDRMKEDYESLGIETGHLLEYSRASGAIMSTATHVLAVSHIAFVQSKEQERVRLLDVIFMARRSFQQESQRQDLWNTGSS